jgi:hypothetical protein
VRYFVVSRRSGSLHIIAEVVREYFDRGQFRDLSLASSLKGDGTAIMLPQEFFADEQGRRALARWRRLDDSEFNNETLSIIREVRRDERNPVPERKHLRLVDPAERAEALIGPQEWAESVREQSARAILEARRLVQESRRLRGATVSGSCDDIRQPSEVAHDRTVVGNSTS